jgi:hypothetical protein
MLPRGADSEHNDVCSKTRFILFIVLDSHCCECCNASISLGAGGTQSFMLRTVKTVLAALQSIDGDEVRT